MCDDGKLTPQVFLRYIEHFQPITENNEQKQEWCRYTKVDATYDCFPPPTKSQNPTQKHAPSDVHRSEKQEKQSAELQTERVDRMLNSIMTRGQNKLSKKKLKEWFDEHKEKLEKRRSTNTGKSPTELNAELTGDALRALSSNIRRVIKERKENDCSLLCDSHDYEVVFKKNKALHDVNTETITARLMAEAGITTQGVQDPKRIKRKLGLCVKMLSNSEAESPPCKKVCKSKKDHTGFSSGQCS